MGESIFAKYELVSLRSIEPNIFALANWAVDADVFSSETENAAACQSDRLVQGCQCFNYHSGAVL
jgi:hypothetical protein